MALRAAEPFGPRMKQADSRPLRGSKVCLFAGGKLESRAGSLQFYPRVSF
jgi:hypothetical protein